MCQKKTADMIEATKKAGKRVIAAGTTSTVVRTAARDNDKYVVPGKVVDGYFYLSWVWVPCGVDAL